MRVLILFSFLLLQACGSLPWGQKSNTEQLNEVLDRQFDERVSRSPESLTYMGKKQDYEKLDDYTEEQKEEERRIVKANLDTLNSSWSSEQLDPIGQVSLKLAKKRYEESLADHKWRHHNYPVNPSFGLHSDLPSFLINFHRIDSKEDAIAYIARVNEIPRVIDENIVQLKVREEKGIILPRFLFPKVLGDIDDLLTGGPFDKSSKPSSLKQDFEKKLEALKITADTKNELLTDLDAALKNSFAPAYNKLRSYLQNLEKKSDTRAGVWKYPDGDEYYQNKLRRYTTTNMSPESIHQLGLEQTAIIHQQMKGILKRIGFKGSLQQFFKKLRNSDEFYYPTTDKGKSEYLEKTQEIIANIKPHLPELFTILPEAELKVKAVESFREKSAPMAFYTGPAPDGSRPGIYYVNLYNLTRVPKYEMEALAYHEALPGHHMQIAIAQNLPSLPKMRKFGGYTAYTEGWGLYAESLPKEVGLYKDPYSEFGRLSFSLLRAGRLVVDTGLHYKKWTREQATQWLDKNTASRHEDNEKAIDRYIVMPGQATSYMIGQLKIRELRDKAEKALGSHFDVRLFHDEVLRHGALPLDVLEGLIEEWILTQTKESA